MNDYQVKKTADKIWNIANMGSKNNPIVVLEHISLLLFFRVNDKNYFKDIRPWQELERAGEISRFNKGNIINIYRRLINDHYYDLDRNLFNNIEDIPFEANVFSSLIDYIRNIDIEYFLNEGWCGTLFEFLILKASPHSINTPKLLANAMVEMVMQKNDEFCHMKKKICDPSCGFGSVLLAAKDYFNARENGENYNFVGLEVNSSISRIGNINLMLHGGYPDIRNSDGLYMSITERGNYDYVITTPPFGLTVDSYSLPEWYQVLSIDINKKNNGIYYYINLCLSLLKDEGRCAIIVPEGLLFSENSSQTYFRKWLISEVGIEGIVSLPSGLFQNTNLKTSLLLLSKVPYNHKIWFYEFDDSASYLRYSSDPWEDLLKNWDEYKYNNFYEPVKENVWITPIEQIVNNNYILSASEYRIAPKKIDSKVVDLEHLFYKLRDLEKHIAIEMEELHSLSNMKLSDDIVEKNETSKDMNPFGYAEADFRIFQRTVALNLSKKQKALLEIYMESEAPIACHAAAKRVNNKRSKSIGKLDVQEAQQYTILFESFGIIESVLSNDMLYPRQSSSESKQVISLRDPIKIVLWKKAERLRR
ncbi:HsdM family class I SAM-dependent methyltransferase [Peribacillus frigoritolerans]